MNACDQFRILVSDLAAGVDMAEGPYRSHVRACEDCESWAQSVFWQDRVLAELAGEARIDLLLGRIRSAILHTAPASLQAETPPPLRIRRPRRRWGRSVAAAAAILLAAVGGWLLLRKPPADPVVHRQEVEKTDGLPIVREESEVVPPTPPEAVRTPPINDEAPPPPPLPPAPNPAFVKKDVAPPDPKLPELPVPPKPDKPVVVRVPDKVGPPIPPPIDLQPRTTAEAVRLGVAYLRGKCEGLENLKHHQKSDELVLWTMLHGGVAPHDPDFLRLLKGVLESKLVSTYEVALQALLLEELDRVSYQWRLQQCAQFLVDNQAKTGLWGYGQVSGYVETIPMPSGSKVAGYVKRGPSDLEKDGKPKVKVRVPVKKQRDGEGGDHSNSMYAALGLRACHDAGVLIPQTVVDLAQKAWRDAQVKGEGGWCYGRHEGHKPYGSMTSGGVGSLVIYDYLRGQDWRKDKDVLEGLAWMAKNFSVTWNPGFHEHAKAENSGQHLYYYLYALERAAILYGTEQIGKRDWYAEGSKALLGSQRPDGAWMAKEGGNEVWDTCFAVLFLQKSTRALPEVVTGVRK